MHPHAAAAAEPGFRYTRGPRRVYWELTRACGLACQHCRAAAQHERLADELTRDEVFAVMRCLAAAEPRPVVVLTGGDPLERPDFWDIVDLGKSLGLHIDVAPSVTPRLTDAVIAELAAHGVGAMSLSLDGSDAARHDNLRGIPGCFERTLAAARQVAAAGIPLQVNTLVTARTLADIPAICARVGEMSAKRWSLFFLVTTGRGALLPQISAAQAEELFEWLYAQGDHVPFVVATTEAPIYRRVVLRHRGARGDAPIAGAGMRDGNGILFLSYRGDVQPSGFLPLTVGNARDTDPLALYRDAPLFRQLREPDGFGGRCGICEYRNACGGSRGRAYAATGDPLAEDPLCAYQPGHPNDHDSGASFSLEDP